LEGIALTAKELTLELPPTVSEGEARVLFAVTLYQAGFFLTASLKAQALRLAGE